MAKYNLNIPLKKSDVEKLCVGDVIFVSGDVFTARDTAHKIMLEKDVFQIPFDPSTMGLYHCGPLMRKSKDSWEVVSAGPTTSDRMDMFEDSFIDKFGVNLIIGKGSMGNKTKKALQKYICVYTLYTGGAGALAADKIQEVKNVYWLKELGMTEAVWIFKVKNFGPLVVAIDSHGKSIYDQVKNKIKRG
ncbi:MAG: FumA C-terminus/TtdB family hydratase beta subunit [Candidatus Thermoplasmatota archaeon]|nr:FumA C-terminus/TtdB family hydratase beta subunit [Candidatus Thermoplasmatota archaeon]